MVERDPSSQSMRKKERLRAEVRIKLRGYGDFVKTALDNEQNTRRQKECSAYQNLNLSSSFLRRKIRSSRKIETGPSKACIQFSGHGFHLIVLLPCLE